MEAFSKVLCRFYFGVLISLSYGLMSFAKWMLKVCDSLNKKAKAVRADAGL